MVIRDIFTMMRAFERGRFGIFMLMLVVCGFVLSSTHDLWSVFADLILRMESTYPPFMLLLTNLLLGSLVRLFTVIAVTFVATLFLAWLSVSYAPEDERTFARWRAKVRGLIGAVWGHLKTIYRFCLFMALLDTIFAGLLHLMVGKEISHYLFSRGDAGFFQLMGLIGERWLECVMIFGALFALTQNEGNKIHYGRFLVLSLTDRTNDLAYTGCLYYALLFGSVDYLSTQVDWLSHAPQIVAPLALMYVTSMYLLGNGVKFPEEGVAEKA